GVTPSARHHRVGVLASRRRREILADQTAPFRKILRAAEINGVILQRLPLHHQTVTLWLLDRAVQLKTVKTPGAAEGGLCLDNSGFKILLGAGLDVDLGDFGDHGDLVLARSRL